MRGGIVAASAALVYAAAALAQSPADYVPLPGPMRHSVVEGSVVGADGAPHFRPKPENDARNCMTRSRAEREGKAADAFVNACGFEVHMVVFDASADGLAPKAQAVIPAGDLHPRLFAAGAGNRYLFCRSARIDGDGETAWCY